MRLDRVRLFAIVFAVVSTLVAVVGIRSLRKQRPRRARENGTVEIATARAQLRDAALQGDASAYAAQYSHVAVVKTRGGNALVGRTAVESAMRKTLSEIRFTDGTINGTTLPTTSDDTFVEHGQFRLTAQSAGDAVHYAGRFVATWRREGDLWKIVTETIDPLVA